jgi:hypothetical protein
VRSTTRPVTPTTSGVVLLDVSQDDPKEGAKIFPGAKAWRNQEHLDNVDAARRMMRLPPLALEDIPLQVITAAEGPAIAEKNQSAWLQLSSDAKQTTLPGGHDLVEENAEGCCRRDPKASRRDRRLDARKRRGAPHAASLEDLASDSTFWLRRKRFVGS